MESRQPMPINDRLNQQYPPEAAVPYNGSKGDTDSGEGATSLPPGAESLVRFVEILSNWRRERGNKRVMEGCDLPYAGVLDEDSQAQLLL
jgi:hypothetical protein